jgi:hypothetical protein
MSSQKKLKVSTTSTTSSPSAKAASTAKAAKATTVATITTPARRSTGGASSSSSLQKTRTSGSKVPIASYNAHVMHMSTPLISTQSLHGFTHASHMPAHSHVTTHPTHSHRRSKTHPLACATRSLTHIPNTPLTVAVLVTQLTPLHDTHVPSACLLTPLHDRAAPDSSAA